MKQNPLEAKSVTRSESCLFLLLGKYSVQHVASNEY